MCRGSNAAILLWKNRIAVEIARFRKINDIFVPLNVGLLNLDEDE